MAGVLPLATIPRCLSQGARDSVIVALQPTPDANATRIFREKLTKGGVLNAAVTKVDRQPQNVWPAPSGRVLSDWQLTGLHQRIRHNGWAVAKMENRTSLASKSHGSRAVDQ